MTRPLRVGDLCVTVNSRRPACNNGVLVVIVAVNPSNCDTQGTSTPYLIRRVDGLPHASTADQHTGTPRWYKYFEAWCAGFKLKRIDDDGEVASERVVDHLEAAA